MRIDEQFRPSDIDGLVNVEQATASRLIFSDETVFQLEMQRIFGRAWLYIGHESEIPKVGDFVTRLMGNDPVILVRATANKFNVLLNSCPHRGAMVCRADAGNNPGFTCPYHGWAFNNDGRLVAMASEEKMYEGKVDFRTLDLRHAAKVGSYAGLIYATWNDDAPSLDDYLGDARWYIDLFFNRTPQGVEVLGPPHRWETQTNWKIGALNFGSDGPHAAVLHGPIAEETLGVQGPQLRQLLQTSPAISWGNGHNGIAPMFPEGMPNYFGFDPDVVPLIEKTLTADQLSVRKRVLGGVNTIFPNNSWVEAAATFNRETTPPVTFLSMRVWQPVAVSRTQISSWIFADKESSEEWKEKTVLAGVRTFSVGGTFDIEDSEAWAALGRGIEGEQAQRGPDINFQMALVYRDKPVKDWPGPGRTYASNYAEASEFDILVEWKRYMAGEK